MPLIPNLPRAPWSRVGAAVQNALEVARFGGLETGEEPAPFEVISSDPIHRLRRYFADAPNDAPPVVLVPPMMLAAEVWDVSSSASAVRELYEGGVDPWVIDFGSPAHEEGGLERTLTDHVLAVSAAVDSVRETTGRDVHLGGYSQGGMFCYQTAAYRRGEGLASVIAFGSPVDTRGAIPFGLPEEAVAGVASTLERFGRRTALPAWASRTGFRLMDPVKAARQQFDFVRQLHDREALLPRENQRRFLQADGWVAWPGPALAEFMRQFVAHNRMLRGGFVIGDRLVTLADINCPVIAFVGEVDEIAPPASVRPIVQAAPSAAVYERTLRAGHFGLVVGSTAKRITWPTVVDWTRWVEQGGELPEEVHLMADEPQSNGGVDVAGSVARLGYGLRLGLGVTEGVARSVVGTATRTANVLREISGEAIEQMPRLTRLEQIRPRTRTSLALLLDQASEKAPDEVLFLFEDRAHTNLAAKGRVDAVVRGLIAIGVRRGEHVGVYMDSRPSALVTVGALNRLGAVAVIMRPEGPVATEAVLGEVKRIITDPEHIDGALRGGVPVFVLGGGGAKRDLGPNVYDMEQIDPDKVELPGWYRANPGRARDLAFVLFTGEGERTRVNRISNRRWLLSAVGTATSASLGPSDTVYSVAPVSHPSGLLVGIGGAIAGNSRLALARRFDSSTFWEEIRRYGVTVSTYTWTMMRELVDAPPEPGERHHPIRLLVGSGMPPALWERVLERFEPARVVEFYTATGGEAVLVNLGRHKIGAMGRRLPGSANVRIADYDIEAEQLRLGRDGFAVPLERGQVGMLLAEADPDEASAGHVGAARGVFRADDAWVVTGDLFRRDGDGDYWLIDPVAQLIRAPDGLRSPSATRDRLEVLDEVGVGVAYGVPIKGTKFAVPCVAVELRAAKKLSAAKVTEALASMPAEERPRVVRVVDEIPVTTWYRPISGPLRKEGLVPSTAKRPSWWIDIHGKAKKLDAAAIERLMTV